MDRSFVDLLEVKEPTIQRVLFPKDTYSLSDEYILINLASTGSPPRAWGPQKYHPLRCRRCKCTSNMLRTSRSTYTSLPRRSRLNPPAAASRPNGKGSSRRLFATDDHSSARFLRSSAVIRAMFLSKCWA